MTPARRPRLELTIDDLVLPDLPAAERRLVADRVARRLEERLAAEPLAAAPPGIAITIPEIVYDDKDAWAPGLLAETIAAAVVRGVVASLRRSAGCAPEQGP